MRDWNQNESLRAHTTFQIGGPAEYFVEVVTEEELRAAVREANRRELPVTILGGGSNMLVSDSGVRGVVIKNLCGGINVCDAENDTVKVTAGAGVVFDDLVPYTVREGYWGLENLSHIPGSVGATPVQNVGAYGVEIGSLVTEVRVYDMVNDRFVPLAAHECMFGYRDSIFKHNVGNDFVVTAVTFVLSRTPRPQLAYKDLAARFGGTLPTQQEIRDAIIEIRAGKFPDWHTVGTAGSFFKNPIIPRTHYEELLTTYADMPGFDVTHDMVKVPLGWILDKVCNVRGMRMGNVGTYEAQALVVINHGGATAHEVRLFAAEITERVRKHTNIAIEWEVTKVGFEDSV